MRKKLNEKRKSLKLNRETIRTLMNEDLADVAGGTGCCHATAFTCNNDTEGCNTMIC